MFQLLQYLINRIVFFILICYFSSNYLHACILQIKIGCKPIIVRCLYWVFNFSVSDVHTNAKGEKLIMTWFVLSEFLYTNHLLKWLIPKDIEVKLFLKTNVKNLVVKKDTHKAVIHNKFHPYVSVKLVLVHSIPLKISTLIPLLIKKKG